MSTLGQLFGPRRLDAIFERFGLTSAPQLPLDVENFPAAPVSDPRLAAIGQENLAVTPLQVSLAMAALANAGQIPGAQLVTAVQDTNGQWQQLQSSPGRQAVTADASGRLLDALLPATGVIAEHVATALSGEQGRNIGWYLAAAPAAEPTYVVVVVVEGDEPDGEGARRVGRALLQYILGR